MAKIMVEEIVKLFVNDTHICAVHGLQLMKYQMEKHNWTHEGWVELYQVYLNNINKVGLTDINKPIINDERYPREVILKRMSEIIVDKLGVEEIEVKEKASFIDDLGADSLDAVELLMDFEKEFNVAIPDDDGEKVRTVGEAVDLLYRLINKNTTYFK